MFFLLPALSGVLGWLSFPRCNQGYVAWFSILPLILFVCRVRCPGKAFLAGVFASALEFFFLLYWIPRVLSQYGGVPGWGGWALFILMAILLGCFCGIVCAFTRACMNRGGPGYVLLFAPAWILLEYARGIVPFGGFPWLLIGYSQTDWTGIIQIADITGVYGVSLLVVWSNVALAYAVVGRELGYRRFLPALAGIVAISGALGYGQFSLPRWDSIQPQFRAAMLQENLSIDEPDSALSWKYQRGYVAMAGSPAVKGADLLILPEAPTPVIYEHDERYRETMKSLAQQFPMGLIFNNIRFGEAAGESGYYNCAYYLDSRGKDGGIYEKIHLVPFGEYIPLQRLFFFSEAISKDVGNFSPGIETTVFPIEGHRANAIICFEAVFPELVRQFVGGKGSELIVNLTNDGWYGDTSAPYQHLAMARWRAIENRRFLLRAANTGISAVISPTGRVAGATPILKESISIGGFSFISETTFYSNHGSPVVILCAMITALTALVCCFRPQAKDIEKI
jgi:apolipoprotein N-acyltransferase